MFYGLNHTECMESNKDEKIACEKGAEAVVYLAYSVQRAIGVERRKDGQTGDIN